MSKGYRVLDAEGKYLGSVRRPDERPDWSFAEGRTAAEIADDAGGKLVPEEDDDL